MPLRRLKAVQRRQQLIEVATRLFAQRGCDATTTAAIAHAAGVTEPILYRHFDDKQDLFIAIIHEMSRHTLEHWRELISGIKDPAEQIRVVAQAFPAHLKRCDDAYHVIHGALSCCRDKKVKAAMKEHYRDVEEFFSSIVRAGQASGQFNPNLDARASAWQMINIGIGYAMVAQNLPGFGHFSVDAAIEFVLRGLSPQNKRRT